MMLPDKAKATPEGRFLHCAALAAAELISPEQAARFIGTTEEAFLTALANSDIAAAVDTEVLRLRYSGELANLKAAKLTDSMLDKLLDTPTEDLSAGTAVRLAELGLRFREKATTEKVEPPKAQVLVLYEGDPDPEPHDGYSLVIRLPAKRDQPRAIEHGEGETDAE